FYIKLKLDPKIDPHATIYTRFRDAIEALLQAKFVDWSETRSGGLVEEVKLTMRGPILTTPEAAKLYRAMNRILWVGRHVRPGIPSNYQVTVRTIQLNNGDETPPNWLYEE